MAQLADNALRGKPVANIYTVLIVVAVLALGVTLGLVIYNLTEPPPVGYGLKFGEMFDAPKPITPPALPKLPPVR